MSGDKKVCVVIPAYNEELNVLSVVRSVKEMGFDIFFMDDGSTDNTRNIVEDEGIKVVSTFPNKGKASVLREGFKRAVRAGYDHIVTMDADGQHDTKNLPKLLRAAQKSNAGIIIGNRMARPENMPFLRIICNKLSSHFVSKVCGQHVPDPLCGFRIIHRRVLEEVILVTERFTIVVELLVEAAKKGFNIVSVEIDSIYADETSHIKPLRDGWRMIQYLIKEMRLKRIK